MTGSELSRKFARRTALLLALAVVGCARTGPPAPVIRGEQRTYPPRQQQASLPAPGTAQPAPGSQGAPASPGARAVQGGIVVKPGDTVYSIARDNGVPLRALIDANGLHAPFTVQPGQHLVLPVARYHIVRRGETVYGIARVHGIAMRDLVRANRIEPPYVISVGQKLVLPTAGSTVASAANQAPAASGPDSPDVAVTALPPPADSAPKPSPEVASLPPETPETPPIPPSDVTPPPREGSRFLWPVHGKVLVAFGPRGGGLHNDGINIAASEGTIVHAAEAGVVAYVGNELQGFGNMVLLRHSGGWMTAYAHNSAILVKRGEVVRRGQPIARVGHSGNVARPQLHFEIRKGDKAVDPMQHLTRLADDDRPAATATASRDGRQDPE